MFSAVDQLELRDEHHNKRVIHEQLNQHFDKQHYMARLECRNCGEVTNIELLKPEDTYLECPKCHKHYLMTYSANRTRLYS